MKSTFAEAMVDSLHPSLRKGRRLVAGVGVAPTEVEFMRLLSVHWSSFPQLKIFGACCVFQSRVSQVPTKKCPPRTCFQVALKSYRPMFIFECGCRPNDPRTKLGCVWDFSRIMITQSVLQVFGLTCINLIRLRKGLQGVNVVIIIHSDRPASVSKRQETTAGSLRLSRGFSRRPFY